MDDICRLCCSTKFVNNNIFDEENALYLKMSLYLPIKVFKNDRLPQMICDKCSCKVNDFYQFCNETIEVQNRLRSIFSGNHNDNDEVIDLTRIKHNGSPLPEIKTKIQGTQTDSDFPSSSITESTFPPNLTIKEEPLLSPVKEESYDDYCDKWSDNSEDNMTLMHLKKKKTKKVSNGVEKRGRKKKPKLKDLESLINSLPDTKFDSTNLQPVKVEGDVKLPNLNVELRVEQVKSEVEEMQAISCCICMAQYYNRNEMLQHYKQHGREARLPTPPAAPPFPQDQDVAKCPRCKKSLSGGEWSAHWLRHWQRDARAYRCALCEKAFRTHTQLYKHGQTHQKGSESKAEPRDKRFICDLCPEGFVYMKYLQAHRLQVHPEAAARALVLRCGLCSRTFAHLNSLRRHLRAHSGERNHLCNVCGKALSSREHLKFHIRIHTGYKPNVCKTCGKGFVKKCNLTLHERIHSGEKPHVCAHCGKAFSQRSTLVIHERYHSGARPYACALCGRGFVAKGLLSVHLKTTCL